MTASIDNRQKFLRRAAFGALLCGTLALNAPHCLAQPGPQKPPETAPQVPNSTTVDKKPGETLSERLDRSGGVIRPPAGVDPGIAAPVPDPHPGTTPVIPPPGTPGGSQSLQPK
jgi:hypothetical protein